MPQNTPAAEWVALLHIGDELTSLTYSGASAAGPVVHLPIGLQRLVREVLRHSPATPGELEWAIALIEDEVMKVYKSLPANASLVTTDSSIRDLALLAKPGGHDSSWVSIEAIEHLFDLLAALSLGRPASSAGIPADAHVAAALLILRELMHHLHFKSIQVLPN